jgi:hypothetical protein
MSGRKIFLYILVSLIAVAVLVAGGYAIYRLGYSHGAAGIRELTLDRRWMPDFNRRAVPDFWHDRIFVGFPFGIIPGVFSGLVFVAMIALAVYGGIKLLFPGSRNQKQSTESQPSELLSPDEEPKSEE